MILEKILSLIIILIHTRRRERAFLPSVDFTKTSNFARFGLAGEYYEASIKKNLSNLPYDGSQAEKVEWENDSTYLDLFIFENEYPRTNGFITFNSSSHSTIGTVATMYTAVVCQNMSFFKEVHMPIPAGL